MEPYFQDETVTLYHGEALSTLRQLPAGSVSCVVTSPPYYGLRDYGLPPTEWPAVEFAPMPGLPPVTVPDGAACLGLETDPWAYVGHLLLVFTELWRVLRDDGVAFLNLGDCYAGKANAGATFDRHRGHGHKTGIIAPQRNNLAHAPYKSLLGIPWRVAFALMAAGWRVRNDITWGKPNGMPESVDDRFTCCSEDLFMLTKSPRYWFNLDDVKVRASGRPSKRRRKTALEYAQNLGIAHVRDRHGGNPGSTLGTLAAKARNPGDVWMMPTIAFDKAHFATMAPSVAERCVLAGCRPDGSVLDPFNGAGTTGMAAGKLGRPYIGIEAKRDYLDLALRTRLAQKPMMGELA